MTNPTPQRPSPTYPWDRWRQVSRARITDVLIVLVLIALNTSLLPLALDDPEIAHYWPNRVGGLAAGAALALVLLIRRYHPMLAMSVLILGGVGADNAQMFVWGSATPGIGVAVYSTSRYLELRRALFGPVLGVVLYLVALWLTPMDSLTIPLWIDFAFYLSCLVAVWWLGRLVRMRVYDMRELKARAERLERARDAHTRAVLAEERSRIARELHDVVAHHISVMTVQATAGQRIIERSPDRARQALLDIEETGRLALSEMRRIVGVLRTPQDEADRSPRPGVDGLRDLVRQMRETGMEVELRIDGEVPDLAPGLDLTLYRVVQESLTNVLKHAGEQAAATVTLVFERRTVTVTVADDGTGPAADRRTADEPGHGLVGMRERVGLYGGDLDTGPRPDGGFEVRARVPVEAGSGR
ncbi:sensor histidine kinase [Nocardiopsis gilva]|uniref:sensor histidine kinase n=1 Tax=Nocardiopsis gilva TaxID=280236 RepID=UPI001E44A960|nr:sensor histidine kinase [Nocardiopsis gilva]